MLRKFRSRKAVSGSISAIFLMLITFLAMSAIHIYAVNQDRYNQVMNERNRLDWEIEKEEFEIISAVRNADGALNATIFNSGALTANIVDIWITLENETGNRQQLYAVDYFINPAEILNEVGMENATELPSGSTVSGINLPQAVSATTTYTIKIISKRGNAAIYHLTPSAVEGSCGGSGQDVPMKITWNQPSFQYLVDGMGNWTSAWEINRCSGYVSPIFRVNVTNLAEDNIELRQYSVTGTGQFGNEWSQESYYILDEGSTPNSPIAFSSQTIPTGEWRYVYFGASIPGGSDLQSLPSETNSYEVFINLHFNHEGETVYYGITISLMSMYVYKSGC